MNYIFMEEAGTFDKEIMENENSFHATLWQNSIFVTVVRNDFTASE